MTGKGIVYPIIVSEYDDDGHYFVATSPNISGMVTQGDTLSEVAYWAEDAIATMIAGEDYPTPQDPTDWPLKENERVIFISVNMVQWLKNIQLRLTDRTARSDVSSSTTEDLRELVKNNGIEK